ncbi:acyl-CoA dehydrogenase family protein [Chelatococcus reniformis]|uniref:Pimeloyl-CoA dehydrogenase small subunit n=1 Tax=Chelatococcus reniformis TaxID=1494448 RepID=A0A916UHA9_9HYPH|nr:acyl-CoA dehydrogenase [Chelatococcus reniformis]GGC72622.1 pimeloyl-CoA dehydrogenase small subunit [Chelatococcus reniformis]
MDLEYSTEQSLLRDSVERFVRDDYAFQARQKILANGGFSAPHWTTFAELGWLGIPFAEEDGGFGGSAVDLAVIMEGVGRGLVLEPFLPTIMAGGLIAAAASSAQKQAWLTPLIAGECKLAVAFAEPQSRYDLADCTTRAAATGAGWRLEGRKCVVVGGKIADAFIVVARTSGDRRDRTGLSLFLVPADADGLTVRRYDTNDGQGAADLELAGVALGPDALLGPDGAALDPLERAVDGATAAVAAEAVGAMAALCDATLAYLKVRKQFGKPLGSNQALQHRMVDMVIALEEARSAALAASLSMTEDDAAARSRAISLAKIEIGRTATKVGQEAVQLHGAMGVTDELDVGHYFKRLTIIATSFGNADWHIRRVAALDAATRRSAPEQPAPGRTAA